MLIRIPKRSEVRASEITDEDLYLRRRELIRAGAVAAGALLLPACSRADSGGEADPSGSGFGMSETVTPFEKASSYNNFYEFGTGKKDPAKRAHTLRPRPWTLEVGGECHAPATVDIDALLAKHAIEDRTYRLRCVEAWSMVIPWRGISLAAVLESVRPTSRAKFVAFRTLHDPEQMPGQKRRVLDWPYREGLRIDEAMHPLSLLATGMYGRDLPNQNGAPIRLVVPWKYGFKSIKSIVSIELVEQQPRTSWNMSAPVEYGFYANVNPEVDHPRWSQSRERRIGEWNKRDTRMFNGYAEEVGELYAGMDLRKHF